MTECGNCLIHMIYYRLNLPSGCRGYSKESALRDCNYGMQRLWEAITAGCEKVILHHNRGINGEALFNTPMTSDINQDRHCPFRPRNRGAEWKVAVLVPSGAHGTYGEVVAESRVERQINQH
jgi:hypothetical protein